MSLLGKIVRPLLRKIFSKGSTPIATDTAAHVASSLKSVTVPIAQAAEKKLNNGIKLEQLRQFLGKDIDLQDAKKIAKNFQERLPENCRIDITTVDGRQLTICKLLPGTDLAVPVSGVECNVTGAGNRLGFFDDLVNGISDFPKIYGFGA